MSIFEPVKLRWQGAEYDIPANKVLRALAVVESVITLQELPQDNTRVPLAKISMAYGALLRFAGARVTDDEVYLSMWGENGADPITAVNGIIALMLPKKVREKIQERTSVEERGSSEGNVEAVTAAASSN